jgi:hypothetical protein
MILSGIKFYNQNQNNTLIANAINSTLTPTDEIVQPGEVIQAGTVTVTQSSVTVTGVGTNFNLLAVGQLFFVFIGTVPSLIGEILTITNSTSITLKATGASPISGSGLQFAATNKLIRTNQSIYMVIPNTIVGNTFRVATPRGFRGDNDYETNRVIPSILSFSQASVANFPNIPTAFVNVPLLLRKTTPVPGIIYNPYAPSQYENGFGPSSLVSYSSLPTEYWYLLDPYSDSGTGTPELPLLANTTFQVYTDADFDVFTVVNNSTTLDKAMASTSNNSGGYY